MLIYAWPSQENKENDLVNVLTVTVKISVFAARFKPIQHRKWIWFSVGGSGGIPFSIIPIAAQNW